jgi:hypothetical protein
MKLRSVIIAAVFCVAVFGSCDQVTNSQPDVWTMVNDLNELKGTWEGRRTVTLRAGSEYNEYMGTFLLGATIPTTSLSYIDTLRYDGTTFGTRSRVDYSRFMDDIVKANPRMVKDVLWLAYSAYITSTFFLSEEATVVDTGKYYIIVESNVTVSSTDTIITNNFYINQHRNKIKMVLDTEEQEAMEEFIGGKYPDMIYSKK